MTLAANEARVLGARGSRSKMAGADPAGPLSEATAALLAEVPLWWTARAREVGLGGLWLDVHQAVLSTMPELGLAAPVQPDAVDVDWTGAELGAAYVASLTAGVRARHGRHYTPSDLADHLWLMTRKALKLGPKASRLPGLIRDTACGAGALLIPPLREHVTASVRTEPALALAALPNVIEGVDADPAAVWLACVVLAAEALPLVAAVPARLRRPLPPLARVGDGLAVQERPARAAVINPPYGRVRLEPPERERWSHVLYGHANLYGLFMAAALDGLDDDGVLAALVPTSFTSGLYFSKLRDTLGREAPLRDVAFVAARDGVFSDVLQETVLAVFDRRKARRTSISSINGHVTTVAQVKSPRGPRPWLLPRRGDDAPYAAAAAELPLRLADAGYRCSTGPLVWNRRTEALARHAATGRVKVIWAADIDGGALTQDTKRNHLRYITLSGTDQQVLVQTEPALLVQRTTAPEQPRRIVAAELTADGLADWGGRVVIENHVNVLRPVVAEPLISLSTLRAVLSSAAIDRVIRSLSGSVAVSAYEIEAVPLPSADVLQSWNLLAGPELEAAITSAYRVAR